MAAWQGFYDELATTRYPALLAYATLLTGSRAAAEDLLHDAFVRVFSRPRRLDSARHAEAYVRRALANLAMDRARGRARDADAARRAHDAELAPDPAGAVDERLGLASALARLPLQVRTCVVLKYYDDLTVVEIAERLGIATGTVKRYLSDARALLGELVDVPGDGDHETTVVVVKEGSGR
jgi:RNA polymerase sigma-70 factor (sigma-E family)